MYIKLKIKSREKLVEEFDIYSKNIDSIYTKEFFNPKYSTIRYFRNEFGKEITHKIKNYYQDFESVPEKIMYRGFNIRKEFLEWEKNDEPIDILPVGLLKLHEL